MQLTVARKRDGSSANGLARDWAALGRSVRLLALEAVALHFATVGALEVAAGEAVGSSDGDARVNAMQMAPLPYGRGSDQGVHDE